MMRTMNRIQSRLGSEKRKVYTGSCGLCQTLDRRLGSDMIDESLTWDLCQLHRVVFALSSEPAE